MKIHLGTCDPKRQFWLENRWKWKINPSTNLKWVIDGKFMKGYYFFFSSKRNNENNVKKCIHVLPFWNKQTVETWRSPTLNLYREVCPMPPLTPSCFWWTQRREWEKILKKSFCKTRRSCRIPPKKQETTKYDIYLYMKTSCKVASRLTNMS